MDDGGSTSDSDSESENESDSEDGSDTNTKHLLVEFFSLFFFFLFLARLPLILISAGLHKLSVCIHGEAFMSAGSFTARTRSWRNLLTVRNYSCPWRTAVEI